jgi:hypothetical protein
MNDAGLIPVNENLHLLLGGSTTNYATEDIAKTYASQMVNNGGPIIDSWTYAGSTSFFYNHIGITAQVRYAVTGWANCWGDRLLSYNDPDTSGGLSYQEYPVYTP